MFKEALFGLEGLGIRPGAVILGVIVDLILTIFFGTFLFGTFLLDALSESAASRFIVILIARASTVVGGYIAAARARVAHLRHGACVGLVVAIFLVLRFPGPPSPLWGVILACVVALAAGVAGGYIALRHRPEGAA